MPGQSGVMRFLDSSTVAGAASELALTDEGRTDFPFKPLGESPQAPNEGGEHTPRERGGQALTNPSQKRG